MSATHVKDAIPKFLDMPHEQLAQVAAEMFGRLHDIADANQSIVDQATLQNLAMLQLNRVWPHIY